MTNKKSNKDPNWKIIVAAAFAVIAFVFGAVWMIFKVFGERDDSLISERGKKILSDKEDKEKVFKAMREGNKVVETKQGPVYIR